MLRAGIAHFWFVTLHPFDDGNGRLTRAITDLALTQADPQALGKIHRPLTKTHFWQQHRGHGLSTEQVKVLNRLLDGGPKGFADGISASQYQAVPKVSKSTATRHLADLLEKGCRQRLPAGGRSTRYVLAPA